MFAVFGTTMPASALQLVSVQNFKLEANEYVSAFSIHYHDLFVRAVCDIPPGWSISAGAYGGSAEGTLTGNAGVGAAFLDSMRINQLKKLFLIEDPIEVLAAPRGNQPQTFNGQIYVGTYGSDDDDLWRRLKSANFVLTPASRCPDPTPHSSR